MLVKKVTYFGEFGYLDSSCIRKSIILLSLSCSRDKYMLLLQNSCSDRCFCWFPNAMLVLISMGTSMASPYKHTNLYKFV